MVKLTRLKLIRERKALTQAELAERAGVSRITVARLGGRRRAAPGRPRESSLEFPGAEPEALMDPLD